MSQQLISEVDILIRSLGLNLNHFGWIPRADTLTNTHLGKKSLWEPSHDKTYFSNCLIDSCQNLKRKLSTLVWSNRFWANFWAHNLDFPEMFSGSTCDRHAEQISCSKSSLRGTSVSQPWPSFCRKAREPFHPHRPALPINSSIMHGCPKQLSRTHAWI